MLLTHSHYPKVPPISEYDSSGVSQSKICKSHPHVEKGFTFYSGVCQSSLNVMQVFEKRGQDNHLCVWLLWNTV